MKIGIDARFYGPTGKGLGRYVQELVEHLQEVDRRNKYVIFLKRENYDLFKPVNLNFQKALADVPWYSLAEQFSLPVIFGKENLDLLHVPHFDAPIFYRGKFVATIHDLTKHVMGGKAATTKPYPVYLLKYAAYKFVTTQAINRAAAVVVPSQYVKDKVVQMFKVNPDKVSVTYEAGTLLRKDRTEDEKKIENVLVKFRISKPYFLYVGNVYPFKNVSRLLDAIKILNEEMGKQAQLVLVGAPDMFWKRLEREVVRKDVLKYVVFTGYVTDVDLIDLYKEAEAHVQPSLSEGFGLTSVEAMSLGTPVVQANSSCLPEIAGEAALYFDPFNPKDMAEKLGMILGNTKLKNELSGKGIMRAKKFSWEKTAEETLRVYERASR